MPKVRGIYRFDSGPDVGPGCTREIFDARNRPASAFRKPTLGCMVDAPVGMRNIGPSGAADIATGSGFR